MTTTADLQIEYIRALVARLRTLSPEKDAAALCNRIESNLDSLVELLMEAPEPDAADAGLLQPAPEPVVETGPDHASDIPRDIPEPAPAVEAAGGEEADANLPGFLERTFGPVAGPEALTVERLKEAGHAPVQRTTTGDSAEHKYVPKKAPRFGLTKCEPGCGDEFHAGPGFASHRRNCKPYQAYVAAHVREVEPLPGAIAPAATADALAGREADDARRRESARAKADETWRNRHGQA